MTEESPAPSSNPRRHDLDALRAFAMLIGVGLHAALAFIPDAWIVQDSTIGEASSGVMSLFLMAVHGFRMPVFFLMSGFFTAMLWRRRGLIPLLQHRFKRIFIPLLLGCVTIVPLMYLIYGVAIEQTEADADKRVDNLWKAAGEGDVDAIAMYAEAGADLNAREPISGSTALTIAAVSGEPNAVEALLKAGADPNARNRDTATALMAAAFFGRAESMKLLLKAGGDPDLPKNDGSTARTALTADRGTTEFAAALIQMEIDWEETVDGRKRIARMLGGTAAEEETKTSDIGRAAASIYAVLTSVSFHHLWFLWFLCILAAVFAVYALLLDRYGWRPAGGAWILSPMRYLWVIPLTMIPQWWMSEISYGPDTSAGVIPMPHALLYYAIFFGFGAVYYDCGDEHGSVGKWWPLTVPLSLLILFPLGLGATYGYEELGLPQEWRRPLADLLQVSYTWFMTFGLMGLFRRLLQRENRAARYVSDSTYWLYLAHLPLTVLAQIWMKHWNWNPFIKFTFVCVLVTGVVLVSYEAFVRYTWVGAMLNGRKTRPKRIDAAPLLE